MLFYGIFMSIVYKVRRLFFSFYFKDEKIGSDLFKVI